MDTWTDIISPLNVSFIQGMDNDEIHILDLNDAYGIYIYIYI